MPFFGGGGGGGGDYLILSHGNINGAGAGAMPLLTGTNDMALGVGALNAVTTGSNNVMLGDAAASNVTTGSDNTVLGNSAGLGLSTSSSNVIIGANSVPSYNTFASVIIGATADIHTGASESVGIGFGCIVGDQSVAIGANSSTGGVANGLNSIAIGINSHINLTDLTLPSGIAIGANSSADSNSIAIGDFASAGKSQLAIGVGQTETFICGLHPPLLLDINDIQVTLPADTADHIVYSFSIPAKKLQNLGEAEIWVYFSTVVTVAPTFEIKANGTTLTNTYVPTLTTSAMYRIKLLIKNNANAQKNFHEFLPDNNNVQVGMIGTAINYDADVTIDIHAKKAVAGDTVAYEFSSCKIIAIN